MPLKSLQHVNCRSTRHPHLGPPRKCPKFVTVGGVGGHPCRRGAEPWSFMNCWEFTNWPLVGGFPGTWLDYRSRNIGNGIIIPIDELIFFRGVAKKHQAVSMFVVAPGETVLDPMAVIHSARVGWLRSGSRSNDGAYSANICKEPMQRILYRKGDCLKS